MSFADIGSIIRKFTRVDDDNKSQEKDPIALISKDTQAFKLFWLVSEMSCL